MHSEGLGETTSWDGCQKLKKIRNGFFLEPPGVSPANTWTSARETDFGLPVSRTVKGSISVVSGH